MSYEEHEVAELVTAFEGLQERVVRLPRERSAFIHDALPILRTAIAELGRHGVEALPIMEAVHQTLEDRIERLEAGSCCG